MSERQQIRRALVSVYDKTGLPDLARRLDAAGVEIVSTGSTAATIRELGIAVRDVAEVTGFPEMLDGRVKTLHPVVHGGLLADRRLDSHRAQLAEHGIEPIDLLVVNLYPFEDTVAAGGSFAEIIEKIDIGGPAMVRSAAKNFASCAVVVRAEDYDLAARGAEAGGFTLAERQLLSAVAFDRIADYDAAIGEWTVEQSEQLELDEDALLPADVVLDGDEDEETGALVDAEELVSVLDLPDEELTANGMRRLRYGENPHQRAVLDTEEEDGRSAIGLAGARLLGGKPMSYNNYVDTDAALRAVFDHRQPCVAVVKHNNPCGLAVGVEGEDLALAHARAHATDPVSAYGGVIATNRPVTLAMAQQVKPIFTEVIAAPDYEGEALALLQTKKNLRILQVDGAPETTIDERRIWGGALLQETDRVDAPGDDPSAWTLAAGEPVDDATLADLEFAWRAIRGVKSNAILLADGGATVGIGMGQVNRLDSCRLAVTRANTLGEHAEGQPAPERARGAVAASDAFFPFADGVQILLDAGVRAVVQPGGSIRDEEVVAACREAGIPLYLTGTRHFAH